MKKALCFLMLALLLSLLTLPLSAHSACVIDSGNLLTEQEVQELEQSCKCVDYDIDFYVLTRQNLSSYLSNSQVRNACGISRDENAIVLLIRTHQGTFYYDMYTFGEADGIFSDSDVDDVLDAPDVYSNLKSGHLGEGALAFNSRCQNVLNSHYQQKVALHAKAPLIAVATGVGVGLLAGGITALCIVLSYRKKRHGESYPLDRYARLQLTQHQDIFVGSHVTRVRVQSASSGSRGGGFGGGGGHRGGR